MTKTETRQSKRTPVTLKIKFKSATLDQFIERYAIDVSQGGIFIRTKDPLPVGTTMRFEFQLRDASPLIMGEGTVVWIREHSPNQAGVAPGMGVRFDRITESSQTVLDQILSQKALRGTDDADQPFTETPTRVAPAPLVDDLAKETKNRTQQFTTVRAEPAHNLQGGGSAPVPFRSDADEFSEEAFEQATKVHSLDDLAAASMRLGAAADEPLELGTAGGVEEEEEDLPIQAGDAVVLGAAGARDNAGANENPIETDDTVMLGAAGASTATHRAHIDDAPSQTDDRAQTTIFPSKHRIRPMVSLPPAASVAGAGSASGGTSEGSAGGTSGGTSGGIRPAAQRDSDRTNPRVSLAVDPEPLEPTVMREPGMPSSNMAAVEANAEDRASAASEPAGPARDERGAGPGDDHDAGKPASTASGFARSRTVDAVAEGDAHGAGGSPANADRDQDGSATPHAPAAAVSRDGEEEYDEDSLTSLISKPVEPAPRSRMPVFLAVAAALVVLGGGGVYLFTRSSEPSTTAPQVDGPDPTAAAGHTGEPGEEPQAAPNPEPELEIEPEPEPEVEIDPEPEIEPAPPIETVEIVVRSSPEGATATLVDTAQEGPTPMRFEVDASKTHVVRISHPGYVSQEITLDPKSSEAPRVALEPAPWIMRFTSTPAGAVVYLDGRRVPKLTPNELTLPPGWEKKKHFKVSFRLAHHEKLDIMVDNQFEADSAAMVQQVDGTMVLATKAPAPNVPRHAPASPKQDKPSDGNASGHSADQAAAPESEAEPSKSETPPASTSGENAAPASGDQAPAP